MCAPCKAAAGDEPRIKRLDDYSGREAEDVVETYFTPTCRGSRYFENVIARLYSGQTSLAAEGEPA